MTTATRAPRRSPSRKPTDPAVGEELLAEVDWLLKGGVHPLLIADQLHRTVGAIEITARRHNRPDLQTLFAQSARTIRKK